MVVRYQRRTLAAPISGTLPVAQAFTFSLGGKTPKAAIFRMTSGTALGTALTPARVSEGCTDGTTHRALGCMSENGPLAGSADSGYLQDTATVLQFPLTTSEARDGECEFVSFAADTVNVRWPDLPAFACQVECEVIYGDDADVKVKDFVGAGSLSGGADFVDIAGVGFTYGHLHAWSAFVAPAADDSGANARISIGFSAYQAKTGLLTQAFMVHEDRDRPTVTMQVVQRIGDNGIAKRVLIGTTGTVTDGGRIEVTSVSSDGCRLTTRDVGEVVNGFLLFVRTNLQRVWSGIPANVVPAGGGAAGVLKTSATGTHLVRDPGFLASDVEALATSLNSANSNISGAQAGHWSHGGSDGTTPVVSSYVVEQGATTSNSHSEMSSGFVRVLKNDATDDWVAALVLGDSLGFGANVTTASSADRISAFLVLSEQTLEAPTAVALALVLPAVTRTLTEKPTAVALALVLPAVARLLTEKPTALALPLVLPAVTRRLTETPAAVALPLVLPAPTRLLTEKPTAVALVLALPAPTVILVRTPSAVALALVLPAVTRLVTETPAAVALPLVLPAPTVILRRTPAAVALPLVLPAPSRLLTATPAAVPLPLVIPGPSMGFPYRPAAVPVALVLPAPTVILRRTPAAVALPLVLPAPSRLVVEVQAAVALALVLPAPRVLLVRTPAAVPVALVLPAPALALTRKPAAVVLSLTLPAVALGRTLAPSSVLLVLVVPATVRGARIELELVAVIVRELEVVAETVRALELEAEAPRALDLVAALE